MGKAFLKNTADLLQKKHKRKQWQKIMISLSLVVALLTSCLLIHPAITMSRQATCGQEEHTHTEKCYEKKLICNKEEQSISESSETEGEESVEAHTHSDACYENVLICGKQEHTHSEACYPKEEEKKEEVAANTEEEKSEDKDVKSEDQEDKAEEKTEDTEKAEARTLKVDQADYTVEVDCPAEANIPKDAKLNVREIKTGTAEYNGYYEKAQKAVASGDETDISFARFFDISFEVDGKEIEPEANVEVKITYDDKVEVPEKGKVKSVHFGNKTEVLDVKTNEKNGKMDEVKFNADSFSVYAIVGTEKSTSSTLTYPEVDQTFTASITGYNISVDVLAKSFEREVTLKATEQAWDDLEEDVQKQLTEQGVSEENSTSLDLHFEDADGNEVEPVNKVNVKFTIREENVVQAVNADEGSVLVYHAEETKDDNGDITVIDVKQVASTNDDTVMAENNSQATAEFETDSFSTFTLSYFYGWATLSNIYVVDMNGNGIGKDQTYDMNGNSSVDLSTVIANASPGSNYTFVRADIDTFGGNDSISSNNASNYRFTYNNNKWRLTNGTSSYTVTWKDVYLVYKKSDGNVTVTFDENGGSTTPDPITMSGRADSTIKLPDYKGNRSGYTFKGWAEVKTLLSATYHDLYAPESTYKLPDNDITLYAVWHNDNYTNTSATFYIRLDGTIPAEPGSFQSSNYTVGTSISGTINDQHWIVDTDGTKKITTTGSKNEGDKNYLENNVTSALTQVPTNEQLMTDINNSSKQLGFTVGINKDGELYVISSSNSNYSSNDLLYVHWYVQKLQDVSDNAAGNWHVDGSLRVKSKVSITYDGNPNSEADGVPVSYQTDPGTEINIGSSSSPNGTVPTTTRTGYVFEGWNTKPDGSGTTYRNNDKFILNEDTTLYAMWSKGYNHLTVNKKDENDNVLAGAIFKLEEKTDNSWTEVNTGITNDAGIYTYNNVRSTSIYRLTETYAPTGYETCNSFCFKVDVDPDNQSILAIYITNEEGVTINTPNWLTVEYTQANVSGGSGSISMNITDKQIKRNVTFKKVASDGTTVLSGAKFSLTKNDATITGVLKEESDTDGIFSTENATLTYGTYILTEEEAPLGYQKADPITITLGDYESTSNNGMTVDTVNATVDCELSESGEDNKVTTTYNYTVTVKDKPQADLTVIKTDNKTPATKLGGVTFKLTKDNNGSYVAVSITDVTDQNGQFTIADGEKNVGVTLSGLDDGTYRLTETQAPSGYIIKNSYTTFTVEDGQITLGENQAYASYDSDSKTLTIKNDAGEALPNTGGSGTLPYTLGGLTLMSAAALMYGFIMRRRGRRLN